MSIPVFRVKAPKLPSATLIFLHGLGDTYEGWSMLAGALHSRPDLQHVNIVLPQAPTRLISGFNQQSTGWFDLHFMGPKVGQGCDGLLESIDLIKSVIKSEQDHGIDPKNIILGGFSQGAALALSCAITLDTKLAGFIAHSGFLTEGPEKIEDHQSKANLDTPVLMLHGLDDDVVCFDPAGKSAVDRIKKFGFSNVKLETYPGLPHSASIETIDEIIAFAQKNLKV